LIFSSSCRKICHSAIGCSDLPVKEDSHETLELKDSLQNSSRYRRDGVQSTPCCESVTCHSKGNIRVL